MTHEPVQMAFAAVLVDELHRFGLGAVAVAPGSRSTPLALAFAADGRARPVVALDERSAAFFALGAAKASGRPGVVVTTSGTAVANLLPALVEARYSSTPMIAITADRPPELRDTGANQTIDQTKIFGTMVKWFGDPGVPRARPGTATRWRSLAAQACIEAVAGRPGPVHLNLPFEEPLMGGSTIEIDDRGRSEGRPWHAGRARTPGVGEDSVAALIEMSSSRRGLLVVDTEVDPEAAAAFAERAAWPLLATPFSGCRHGPNAVSAYDALCRVEGFTAAHRPDVVVQIGGQGTSRHLQSLIASTPRHLIVDRWGHPIDPSRTAERVLVEDPSSLLRRGAEAITPDASGYLDSWMERDRMALKIVDDLLEAASAPTEPRLARDLAAGLRPGTPLFVGSSMPVRDLEWFMTPREGLRVIGNRGASGIDGAVSTALGIAHELGPTVALIGDLSLLHDRNGLQLARERADCVFVVVNNDGGGIFSFLEQTRLHSEQFERLFATPHGYDLAAIAAAEALPYTRLRAADEVVPAVTAALEMGGAHILEARTDRRDNLELHQRIWKAVESATDAAPEGASTRRGRRRPSRRRPA